MITPAPFDAVERIESLDVLRGFALLGILAMNIRMMAAPFGAYMFPYTLWDFDGGNRLALAVTAVFFDLKMMGLLSMLFGILVPYALCGLLLLWWMRNLSARALSIAPMVSITIAPKQLGVVVAIWILQLVWSPIWLRRFRFGPAEWLWRSPTYGRVQRFSRAQANPVGAV